jgi:MscS family membrane protein
MSLLLIAQTMTTQPATAPVAEPPWYAIQFLNNAVWRWGALLGVLIITFALARLLSFIIERQGRWMVEHKCLSILGMSLTCIARPVSMLLIALGLYLVAALRVINLEVSPTQDVRAFWIGVCKTIAALAVGWAVYRLVDVVDEIMTRLTSRTHTKLDDQLIPVIRKALRAVIIIMVLLFIAQNIFHWDIGALIAGLGLGGLAFALAAQDALKNLFGSVTIFADRPFQIGDWVVISGYEGIVEEVGFRSTRVRTFYGHRITLPNANVANAEIDNVSSRAFIRRNLNVTVTYDTPPDKLARGIDILKEMLTAREASFPPDRPGKVYFSDFNDCSLNILVVYWHTPPDYWQAMHFHHEFNMEVLRRFNDEGIEFAFPTQTLYVKQDSPMSADVRMLERQGDNP